MTDRQRAILYAVIKEFMENAEAVGSGHIVTKHGVSASPATVRHEMVELADKGYLEKRHLSSGRIPTDLGFRFFVQELMEEEPLENIDEVNVRIGVHKQRFNEERLMNHVLKFLSKETKCAAMSMMKGSLRYRGVSSLMRFDELRDLEVMGFLLDLFESKTMLERLFSKGGESDVCVLIGEESDIDALRECAVVFSQFGYLNDKKGYLGVIGPRRMPYSRVIPTVKAVSSMVEHAVRGW